MKFLSFLAPALIFLLLVLSIYFYSVSSKLTSQYHQQTSGFDQATTDFKTKISELEFQLSQVKSNQELMEKISQIKKTFISSIDVYQDLLDLKVEKINTAKADEKFAQALKFLSQENYASASALLVTLKADVAKLEPANSVVIPANVPQVNTPPNSGFQKQVVKTDSGEFLVDIISADLKTTKVIVDTASDKDCHNDCPVMALAEYANRSGAFAAINGPYFCPATYPACADKKNTFDTLLMNRQKTYFNSDNNVYSNVPAAIFSSSSRFIAKSSEWGRDTSIDSVIAGQPLLVFNGQPMFAGDNDPKKSSKGNRAFIGATDSTVYIGVLHGVSVADAAQVLSKMGIKNAINLDSGGSLALWQNGKYLAGPGRNTPFGILLVKR
jgi:exopolysaccharide biosynthesis protein